MSQGARVLLGVGGGIAAYKAAELTRRLRARGHEVRVALTRSGAAFVTPLTLEVLTGYGVYGEEYLTATGSGEEAHIAAAQWAEVLCVAPATANLLARLALGLADDFLSTTALAFAGPLVVAPAMHTAMWAKPTVQEHVRLLRLRGARVVGPVEGPLASGETGMGRMAEPEEIADAIAEAAEAAETAEAAHAAGTGDPLGGRTSLPDDPRAEPAAPSQDPVAERAAPPQGPLSERTVLITAGPTYEPLDPVRFLGNRSSGKMGFALAAGAARRGARVTLIAGPVALATPPGVERIDVGTAEEMARAVASRAGAADLVVMAAAVADFRPRRPAASKIKKEAGPPALDLERTPDILAGLRDLAPGAVVVGFAAETEELAARAAGKLEKKRADFLVANDVSRPDIGFGQDDNEVVVFRREGEPVGLARAPKAEIAERLLDLFGEALARRERPAAARRRPA